MMVRAFSLLATWLGLIVQLRVANAATSNYRNNRNNSTVAEFGGVIFLGGWRDIRPGVDGEDAPSRCEAAVIQAAEAGITRLSFVPTTYWADSGPLDPPPGFDPLCQDLDLSGYYCYDRFESTTMSHWCLAKTPEDLIRHNCDEPHGGRREGLAAPPGAVPRPCRRRRHGYRDEPSRRRRPDAQRVAVGIELDRRALIARPDSLTRATRFARSSGTR